MYPCGIEDTPEPAVPSPLSAGALRTVRDDYLQALASLDLRRSRQLVVDAAERGVTLGRLYVDVVRPVLEHTGGAWATGAQTAADRLTLGSVQAALAVVAGRPVEGAA